MRITENLINAGFLQRTARTLFNMTQAQAQISSGKKISRPSDDPRVLSQSLELRSDLRRIEDFKENVSSATAFMSLTESSLQEISDLLSRAKEILVEAANAPSEGIAEDAHSQELLAMLDSVLLIANRDVAGRYLFSGQQTNRPAYAQLGGQYVYQGDTADLVEQLGNGLRVAMNLTGPDAFQTVPSRIVGDSDLDAALSEITKLAELKQGSGVPAGPIRLTDSNGVTVDVDLAGAETIADVVRGINDAGTALVAQIAADGKHLEITDTAGGSGTKIEDINGGSLAQGLGIATETDTGLITSVDLDPVANEDTALALLLGGSGVPAGVWTLRNQGEQDTWEGRIDTSDANTVGDLLRLIRDAEDADGRNLGLRGAIEDGKLVIKSIRPHTQVAIADATGGGGAGALGLAGVGEATDIFAILEKAAGAVQEGDHEGIDSMIRLFTEAIDSTASMRGSYGSRARQVLQIGENLEDQKLDLTIRLSDVEDADLAEAVVELTKNEAIYNASLSTGTRLLQNNLFNFIR